jgi:DNA-binding GntR family transcriptional regulator
MASEVLKDALREKIIALILTGKLQPGERIKEVTLAKLFKVSRTPLREALISLERLRLVRSEPNIGFTVKEISVEEIEELYPLINLLETYALQLAFPLLETQTKELEKINESLYAYRHSPLDASRADQEFHDSLTILCKNETLLRMIAELRLRISCYEHCYMAKLEQLERSYQQHRDIIRAIQEGNKEAAKVALSSNWEYGSRLLIVELSQRKAKIK